MIHGKKGYFGDAAYIVGFLMVIALVVIVGGKFMGDFNTEWQASDSPTNESKAHVQELNDRYVGLWDGIFMLLFGMLSIALILSATAIGTRPEFFIITTILLVFLVGGAAIASNAFEDATDDTLQSTAQQFTFIPLILNNLPVFALLEGTLILLALFIKARGPT